MTSEEPPPEEVLPEPIELPDRGYVCVRDAEALTDCVEALADCEVLGVDTESDSFFSYQEQCCLIQITGNGTIDYIIDPLAIDDLSALGPLMANPEIVKIFHGADYDVVSMKRDFGFEFTNIFDTMIAAQATAHKRFGLSDLVKRYFGATLDKRWQRHDWSSRPLQDAQLDYARKDSHFLPVLREILLEQCAERGRMAMIEEEFGLLAQREWTGKPFDPDSCMRLKGASSLDDDQRRVLRAVVSLREGIAEHKNRPPFKVWGNDICLKLATSRPTKPSEVKEALGPKNHVVRRYGREVLEAALAGRADTSPAPQPPKPPARTNKSIPPFNREDEPLLNALKKWRNKRSASEGLGPGMIVNNSILKDVAALKPREEASLGLLDEMRTWQREEYGADIVAFVVEWLEKNPSDGKKRQRRGGRRRSRGRRRSQENNGPPSTPKPTGD